MAEHDFEWLPDPTYAIALCDIMPSTKHPVNDEEIEVDVHISQGEIAQIEQYINRVAVYFDQISLRMSNAAFKAPSTCCQSRHTGFCTAPLTTISRSRRANTGSTTSPPAHSSIRELR